MSHSILVGTDCSNCSNRALEYAKRWARKSHHKLYVAHVVEWSPFTFSTPQELAERHKRREDELAKAHELVIDPVVEALQAEGIDAEGVIRHGQPAETLNALANELGVHNIIIGRRGQSAIKAKLFGSATITLVQIADHPVTVVP